MNTKTIKQLACAGLTFLSLSAFHHTSFAASAATCAQPPLGLVDWWRGEGDALDAWSFNDGIPMNNTLYSTGKVGSAFNFDGVNSYVAVPDNALWTLGAKPFTIDLWLNFSQVIYRSPFIGHDDGGGQSNKWIFWYDESGHTTPAGPALRFHINSNSQFGPLDTIYYPWTPTVGQWYHVAVTRSGNTYALYLNGVQVATSTNQAYTIQDAAAPLTIGNAEGYFFNGLIDEVDIFDRALSPAEIKSIYQADSLGKCLPAKQPVAGLISGIVPTAWSATCQNLTTGKAVNVTIPSGIRFWDCSASGLSVHKGDIVNINSTVSGSAQ